MKQQHQDAAELALESVVASLEQLLEDGVGDGVLIIYVPTVGTKGTAAEAAVGEEAGEATEVAEHEHDPMMAPSKNYKKKKGTAYDDFHVEEIFAGGMSSGGGGSPLTVTQI